MHLLHTLDKICWLYFQDSLSHMLKNPTWHSKEVDFTAVLRPAPLILEQISDSVSKNIIIQMTVMLNNLVTVNYTAGLLVTIHERLEMANV